MDYWRLCDELNVVQAALLIVGAHPGLTFIVENDSRVDRPKGYDAAKTAICHALRKYDDYCDAERNGSWDAPCNQNYLDSLKSKAIEGRLIPEYESDINGNYVIPVAGSIDLWKSTVDVESLRQWLKHRGFTTGFFFPSGVDDAPDYLDPKNPRYAPKLAAAVKAWLAVTDPGKVSPKKALDKWLREHAAEFGLTDDDGLPINQAVEDCSKVANWNQKGGAPTTPSA